MNTIIAEAVCTIHSGRVRLTAAQAKTRRHNLNVVDADLDGSGLYEVHRPIQFKRGETFEFDGQVAKDGSYSASAPSEQAAGEGGVPSDGSVHEGVPAQKKKARR